MPDDTTDLETLASRLDAVERAVTDGNRASPSPDSDAGRAGATDGDSDPVAADVAAEADVADLERSVDELERRVSELAAELDAVRGLVGGVQAVNESVERRADAALAAAERLAVDRDGADGLVVERLPDEGAAVGRAPAGDGGAGDGDGRDGATDSEESESGSLADRLRGAL